MPPFTPAQLGALTRQERALYDLWAKATVGPWNVGRTGAAMILRGPGGGASLLENWRDQEYAVAAVNAVPVLLERLADALLRVQELEQGRIRPKRATPGRLLAAPPAPEGE